MRFLDVVTMDGLWLVRKVRSMPLKDVSPHLLHLANRMESHVRRPLGQVPQPFQLKLWPTAGPYDKVIRCVARWAAQDLGSRKTTFMKGEESFSFTCHGMWTIELELDLDGPRYLATRDDLGR